MVDRDRGSADAGAWPERHGQDRERDLERIARLRPIDDDFMRVILKDDVPLVEELLRIVTGIAGVRVLEMETQRDIRRIGGERSVELDVWAVDSEGRHHDVEVQRGDDPRPRRARYHSAAMDADALDRGGNFEGLPEQWVVFVMERDPFGLGEGTYLFERFTGCGLPLGDGTHLLYANGAYRGGDELGRLMHDFCEADPARMLTPLLAERVQYFKNTERGRSEMCEIFDEIRQEGIELGKEQGREQGADQAIVESVRAMMESLSVSAQGALEIIKVPEAKWSHYLAML